MTALHVSPGLSFAPVSLEHSTLRSWLPKLRAVNPHFRHEPDPDKWVGLFFGERLLSAIAYVIADDGTVTILGIVCEPKKSGRVAAVALWRILANIWKGRRVLFFVSERNRKMLRAIPTGSRRVASVWEVQL